MNPYFIAFYQQNATLAYGFLFILSLCIGSFLNVVIYRLPEMLAREWRRLSREYLELPPEEAQSTFNLLHPRSTCPKCQNAIPNRFNIPILGYLMLKGSCYHCQSGIPIRYPLV